MVNTQSERTAQLNGSTLPEENDVERLPTHTTSLTSKELRLIHQLCHFELKTPHHSFDPELKGYLYRFTCFMPPPHDLRFPRAWNAASLRDNSDAPLPTAIAKAQVLLNRPGALAPIPASPTHTTPTTVPQDQSPLFSVIPPEIRTRIFEFAVTLPTHDSKVRVTRRRSVYHAGGRVDIVIPTITAVSRLARRETLHLFFKLHNFTFGPFTDSVSPTTLLDDVSKWLSLISSHLPLMHQLTFEVQRRDKLVAWDTTDILSVKISHDPQHSRWIIKSVDDWADKDAAERQSLEHDNALLEQILAPMLDRKSRDDLTPAYLMWLMEDLRRFYAGEKLKPAYPPDDHWTLCTRAISPDLLRPLDMYTRKLEHEYWIRRPYWLCSLGHKLHLDDDGVFRCECEKA